jgi:hypothetical protein
MTPADAERRHAIHKPTGLLWTDFENGRDL